MKITEDTIELTPTEEIFWREIQTIRLANEKLTISLKEGRVIELLHLHPSMIDAVFRAYEKYVKYHPSKDGKER